MEDLSLRNEKQRILIQKAGFKPADMVSGFDRRRLKIGQYIVNKKKTLSQVIASLERLQKSLKDVTSYGLVNYLKRDIKYFKDVQNGKVSLSVYSHQKTSSPKRKSPKRNSPKKRSSKRKSPKRKSKSPKRKSPKRKSPKRKSPKRRSKSPKRKSPKRRSKSPKR